MRSFEYNWRAVHACVREDPANHPAKNIPNSFAQELENQQEPLAEAATDLKDPLKIFVNTVRSIRTIISRVS